MLGWLDDSRDSEWRDGALGITGGGGGLWRDDNEILRLRCAALRMTCGRGFGITRRAVRYDGEWLPLGMSLWGRLVARSDVTGDHEGRPCGGEDGEA